MQEEIEARKKSIISICPIELFMIKEEIRGNKREILNRTIANE